MPPKPNPVSDPNFKPGSEVEISSDDDGFRGSWYLGTIVRRCFAKKNLNKFLVEYKTLMSDEKGSNPLRDMLDVVQLRPVPPRETDYEFKFGDEVDAYHNDGWWEGSITQELGSRKFAVYFRTTREQIEFETKDLRLHREWIRGDWVPPLKEQQVPLQQVPTNEVKSNEAEVKSKSNEAVTDEKFGKGALVEVSSDEDGFQGAWFAATVVEPKGTDKFLIQYQSLRTEDDSDFLKEEVDILHIRPFPPEATVVDGFNLLEEVDALYNDGWWVGVISKVLGKSKYIVYFRSTKEEMEFQHSQLRPHQEWIDGKWLIASKHGGRRAIHSPMYLEKFIGIEAVNAGGNQSGESSTDCSDST